MTVKDKNSRVFVKPNITWAFWQLNLDSDKKIGAGWCADATQDFAPVSTNPQLDFAQAHFAQQFRFGAQAPSSPAQNIWQSWFGEPFNFQDISSVTVLLQVSILIYQPFNLGLIRTLCHRCIQFVLKPTMLLVLPSIYRRRQHSSVTLGTRRKLSAKIKAFHLSSTHDEKCPYSRRLNWEYWTTAPRPAGNFSIK